MRINTHAHIFTAYTVTSRETVDIIVRRIERKKIPFLADAARKVLNEIIDKPEYLSETELLRRLLRRLLEDPTFKEFLQGTGQAVVLQQLANGLVPVAADAVAVLMQEVVKLLDRQAGPVGRAADFLAMALLAMKADSATVAGVILDGIPKNKGDAVLVALMMDITGTSDTAADARRFRRQIRETSGAALAHPGHVLPFFAVHPNRPDHFALLRSAVEQSGFVGVKLYPSLGYAVDSQPLMSVYDYCLEMDLPVTIHCSPGGFYRDDPDKQFCEPKTWRNVLAGARKKLRISLAHCGGALPICDPNDPEANDWPTQVLELMDAYENVYADISYHDEPMKSDAKRVRYHDQVLSFLKNPKYGKRFLFGTDSWLVRAVIAEEHYWAFFEELLGTNAIDTMADVNARDFLGLPNDVGAGMRANIERHVHWLTANADRLGNPPAAWLAVAGGPTRVGSKPFDPSWTTWIEAHYWTYAALKRRLSNAQQQLGFRAARGLTMAEIGFTRGLGESEDAFDQRLRIAAMDIVNACAQRRPTLEGSWNETELMESLAETIREPTLTFAELGAEVDAAYSFPSEDE